jgi:hypothetical protein
VLQKIELIKEEKVEELMFFFMVASIKIFKEFSHLRGRVGRDCKKDSAK